MFVVVAVVVQVFGWVMVGVLPSKLIVDLLRENDHCGKLS
jgi:hypothetical protein